MTRKQLIKRLKEQDFDVLIIGGGATGAGCALDAATRGLKTALIDSHDYAFGTSSRSTKLIHGGVRYLENAIKHFDWKEYELVRDALHERKYFLHNAPHLTHPIALLTPVYSCFESFYYWVGLKIYDVIAGNARFGASTFLSKKEVLKRFPAIQSQGLKGAVLYYDGQFNDARMNIALILSALRAGAVTLNYVGAHDFIKKDKKIVGLNVEDKVSKERWPVYAKLVINATGPYTDSIRKLNDSNAKNIMVPSQGSHIILPREYSPRDGGVVIPKTKDGRVIFLLPWQGKTLAGTTDQPQKITDNPTASKEEVDYIIEHVAHYVAKPIEQKQVLASWSGLRPLAKPEHQKNSTAAMSRDHLIELSDSGLLTIVGGKWTTYRKMAQDVIDSAVKAGSLKVKNNCITKKLKLVGADNYGQEQGCFNFLDKDIAKYLLHAYGDQAEQVIKIDRPCRLLEDNPYIEAEIIYALRYEYALYANDIIARRIRIAFLDQRAALKIVPKVVAIMAQELSWDSERAAQEIKETNKFVQSMLIS
ncbi:MAG: FAD-dependent oxidoreductase [Myxococcales bacterium]|nr:MAG: FAD-dependent oxidoreductase [Myxococcales bacterium]